MMTRRAMALVTTLATASLVMTPVGPAPSLAAAPVSSAPTADLAPVTADDTVTITPLTSEADVHVLANDVDPDHGNLQVCRVEAPDAAGLGVHVWSDNGEPGYGATPSGSTYLTLEPTRELAVGTLTVTYYACDRVQLTPATLTVEVVRITARTVAGRPGVVRFTNPLDEAVDVIYGAVDGEDADGGFTLGAGATRDRVVKRRTIQWFAVPHEGEGDDPLPLGYGIVRNTGARAASAAPGASARQLTARQGRAWRTGRSAHPSHVRPRHVRPGRVEVGRDEPPTGPVEDAAPVTGNDRVTLDYYDDAEVRVLRNDSDDTPGDLAVCWVDVPRRSGLSALIQPWWAASDRARSDSPDRYIELNASAATAGTYRLTYYACDKHRLTPGTLTVTVRRFPPVKVRRVRGHPGTLVFTNRGYRRVRIQYFESHHYSEQHHFSIKPHARRRLHVSYDDLSYFADTAIGPLGSGRFRNLYPGRG
ncbi:Ig-like domain-containing protein [Nocardioides sp.]|uniref:Ig-like domain-containing protein n=1 Tax=Nocardioides sp. TaxID=35761 RepID=UPI00271B4D03|nr:Ig-like domain-containing protein [Nocardioides sp.]MDO9457704.1 hypothetical protein [Nocardioides sp.]